MPSYMHPAEALAQVWYEVLLALVPFPEVQVSPLSDVLPSAGYPVVGLAMGRQHSSLK